MRIVLGVVFLLVVYGLVGRFDRAEYHGDLAELTRAQRVEVMNR